MRLKLREWQAQAIDSAEVKYAEGQSHFLCLATPGAGKTVMASILAHRLLKAKKIDLILCFSPSVNIASAFKATLEKHLQEPMDGSLGAKGQSMTYQSMLHLDKSYWELLDKHRIFVIFDEIHHCASGDLGNIWGQNIAQHIQGKAAYTLALTGTPWRSDKLPIALSNYSIEGKVQCDYVYSLDKAINHAVCRTPKIVAIDNQNIRAQIHDSITQYTSFKSLLESSHCSYQDLLNCTDLINYLLKNADKKLNSIRRQYPDAGGLIVATSVNHAITISKVLKEVTGEEGNIATYLHSDAQETIETYKQSACKWIISIGMISEGTDIPRLRVCCHLSRIKTELSFRQILGRILRSSGEPGGEGFLFMPAEPNLIDYAKRVVEDVPDKARISIDKMDPSSGFQLPLPAPTDLEQGNRVDDTANDLGGSVDMSLLNGEENTSQASTSVPPALSNLSLSETYDLTLDFFGTFRKRVIRLAAT